MANSLACVWLATTKKVNRHMTTTPNDFYLFILDLHSKQGKSMFETDLDKIKVSS